MSNLHFFASYTRYRDPTKFYTDFIIPLLTNKLQPHFLQKSVLLWKSYTVQVYRYLALISLTRYHKEFTGVSIYFVAVAGVRVV